MTRWLLLAMLFAAQASAADVAKIPVVVDTNIGDDMGDAFALAYLLASERVDVKAITTSGGDCEDRAWMVCRLLTMIDRRDIPVAWGHDPQPAGEVGAMYQYRYHPAVLFNRTAKPQKEDAADVLYEVIKKEEVGTAVVLTLGPLTNLARMIEKHPDSKELLGKVMIVGGDLSTDAKPEANFTRDVDSARAVLETGVPIVLVPHRTTAVLTEERSDRLFAAQTMLTQQLQLLRELDDAIEPSLTALLGAIAVGDDQQARRCRIKLTPEGKTVLDEAGADVRVAAAVAGESIDAALAMIAHFGDRTTPRKPVNFSELVERKGLPARVHAFEDFETDIERRWWLVGRPIQGPGGHGQAMQSVFTLDFDDKQGDLKTMYSAVVFNPVPGPPMGPNTRLSFRYRLSGTDQLRVQLYSLSSGYHRCLTLRDLPQDTWTDATVDMTKMRKPDGEGGPLAADERIDDIQFYVSPTASVAIDDVVLYDEAPEGEMSPFPKRLVFTGWFDTGKQGVEWPGDYAIVEHTPPRKWKAAKSIENAESGLPWLRISLRGQRPISESTAMRFSYRLTGADAYKVQLVNSKSGHTIERQVTEAVNDRWQEQSLEFLARDAQPKKENAISHADELRFLLPKGSELLMDDVLLYEPGDKQAP
jgi:hypothetical protein